jgi:hypothetical protein
MSKKPTSVAHRRTAKGAKRRRRRPVPARRIAAVPVKAAELRALKRELDRRMKRSASRWNPDPDEVQRGVAQLVLTIVEFLRRLMERQAIRRMEHHTLTQPEVEAVGTALMRLEETIRDIGARFGLSPDDLNLDLGPVGKLM